MLLFPCNETILLIKFTSIFIHGMAYALKDLDLVRSLSKNVSASKSAYAYLCFTNHSLGRKGILVLKAENFALLCNIPHS